MFVTKLTGLKISKVTFKSFRVDWNPAPEPFVLGYRVRVRKTSLVVPWNKAYAHLTGLNSNTTYILSVLPLHGLTDEEDFAENVNSIKITTKPELGTKRREG